MKRIFAVLFIFTLVAGIGIAQTSIQQPDSGINNLIYPQEYTAAEFGAIPSFVKTGTGKKALILIPGWGFDGSVFDDFVEANNHKYTMFVVTIPGYGKTFAPSMPPVGTSYAELTWNKSFLSGLAALIEKEKLIRPVIVGHFNQGSQLVLRFAVDHPDKIGGAIILGGPPKLVTVRNGVMREFPPDSMKLLTDNFLAPRWFKSINKNAFDAGNYLPEIYSLDSVKGKKLWDQSAGVPLPVMIRYLCELWTMDLLVEAEKIQCPVLVLRPAFTESILKIPTNNYLQPQFIDLWNRAPLKNPKFVLKDVPSAATFVWKDNPAFVYKEIHAFVSR